MAKVGPMRVEVAIDAGERRRIADYLDTVSMEMDGEQHVERLRELWEDVRQMAQAVRAGLFAKPGPYMLLDPHDPEPPEGWERVEGDLGQNWARKLEAQRREGQQG